MRSGRTKKPLPVSVVPSPRRARGRHQSALRDCPAEPVSRFEFVHGPERAMVSHL